MSTPKDSLSRRAFLSEMAAVTAVLGVAPQLPAAAASSEFRSQWNLTPDRPWPGREFWSNPLQDWRIVGGRLECINAAAARNVHVLTRDLAATAGTVSMRVTLGRVDGGPIKAGRGAAGFSLGVQGPLREYRNNLIFGTGFAAGLRASGELFLGDDGGARAATVALGDAAGVTLEFAAVHAGGRYRVSLVAREAISGRTLGEVVRDDVPAAALVGNLALSANYGAVVAVGGLQARPGMAEQSDRWWFSDWRIAGTKVAAHEDRAFGPLWFNHYTLHDGILKMTGQLAPLGQSDVRTARFQVRRGGAWTTLSEATMDPAARTVAFRIPGWDDRADTRYRLALTLRLTDGSTTEHTLDGTVRRDPIDRRELAVADIACNAHFAFPNTAAAAAIAKLNPDLVTFVGDQYYESTGGFGVNRSGADASYLDVLRKWAMHGWTWRDILRDRPAISLPDDHDVYHGNLWGEGGAKAPGFDGRAESLGGYKMTADFVNAVHRMQTSHHPDSPARPGKQGITGYYGPLTYGRVSFALLADRQYKSAPDGKVPPTTSGRADHVNDPNFDPRTADLPGLELLGAPQMEFLHAWTTDWRGADMKAVVSQTIFTAMATHHGPQLDFLVADYDTNAWPQTARNAALRELRRAYAFHLAGDQHLPAVVHYGIDTHRDAGLAFASPAINNLYSRRFRSQSETRFTGDFRDSFGHPLTVLACANPKETPRAGVLEAEVDKSAGVGLVRFDKVARTITIECWPLLADPTQPGTQFPGWPVVVSQLDNHARAASAHLPELTITGSARPVLEVVEEATGETL
ncbi:MAG: alkaline phosphatase D family protein, partial [Gemmatimonadaceae bacterium]